MIDIDWNMCIAGTYSQYNARAKATVFNPAPDGMVEVTLWGGRRLHVGSDPAFSMEYQGGMGSYTRDIDILDTCSDRPWLFEAWCHSFGELHTYSFHKVATLTELATGQSITGEKLQQLLGGALPPPAQS
ncbi:hypothetical protein [Polaromonas sp. OV174]|uniref:hypothetical protein n=1 Tax=Polaromonas sp. OV174 TaxID=1855300 RepID=UPI000B88BA05|nr:hypothetical protein [Polaromonas sp. OV174]